MEKGSVHNSALALLIVLPPFSKFPFDCIIQGEVMCLALNLYIHLLQW